MTSTASAITNYSIEIDDKTINTITNYKISFRNINPLLSNSYIMIVFPSEIILRTDSSCNSIYLSCNVIPFNNTLIINTGMNISSNTNISIKITNVINPITTQTTSSFQINTYYSPNF